MLILKFFINDKLYIVVIDLYIGFLVCNVLWCYFDFVLVLGLMDFGGNMGGGGKWNFFFVFVLKKKWWLEGNLFF